MLTRANCPIAARDALLAGVHRVGPADGSGDRNMDPSRLNAATFEHLKAGHRRRVVCELRYLAAESTPGLPVLADWFQAAARALENAPDATAGFELPVIEWQSLGHALGDEPAARMYLIIMTRVFELRDDIKRPTPRRQFWLEVSCYLVGGQQSAAPRPQGRGRGTPGNRGLTAVR